MSETTNQLQREADVLDFINNKNKEDSIQRDFANLNSSPEIKLRKLDSECSKGTSICLDTILGKIYKDALPFEDPQKQCSDDTARWIMHDYISKRTNGKGSEYYIREAIKKTNSPTLKMILNEAKSLVKEFYEEKAKDIGTIDIKDLDFKINLNQDKLDKLTKKMDLDEVAEIIQKNVQDTLKQEADRAKKEEEYRKTIEDKLAADAEVTDDASMESAMDKMIELSGQPKVYQASLFESILLGKASTINESTSNSALLDDLLTESIHEFTKLNISKALKLESFDLRKLRSMADSYLAG